jgi:hypothetical protein
MVRSVYQNGTASAPPKPLVQNPGSTSICEYDPPENEWQVGYEAALRDVFFKLIGRSPSDTLH